jgi:hypothetical protein
MFSTDVDDELLRNDGLLIVQMLNESSSKSSMNKADSLPWEDVYWLVSHLTSSMKLSSCLTKTIQSFIRH